MLSQEQTGNMARSSAPPKIPAWKLRQEQLRKSRGAPPTALYVNNDSVNEELGSSRSSRSSRGSYQQRKFGCDTGSITSASSTRSTSSMSMSSRSTRSNSSIYSSRSRSSNASQHVSRSIRPVSRVPGGLDPTLPPAFRAAFKREQQLREKNNRNCLASSVASHSRTDACSTTGQTVGSDISSLDSEDDNDFDDEDSFASIDSDADEEDDAYLVSRNQMARFTIETKQRPRDRKKVSRFQKKTTGVHGTPLGLIAE